MEQLIQKFFDSPKLLLAVAIVLLSSMWGLVIWDVIDPALIITG